MLEVLCNPPQPLPPLQPLQTPCPYVGHWRRGQEGELDETRLVDALAGEANVFRSGISRAGNASMGDRQRCAISLKADRMIEASQSNCKGWDDLLQFVLHDTQSISLYLERTTVFISYRYLCGPFHPAMTPHDFHNDSTRRISHRW